MMCLFTPESLITQKKLVCVYVFFVFAYLRQDLTVAQGGLKLETLLSL